uniref:Cilia and flagella associated protein 107 n=1 Tax=Erpetoichthys calabaricus TaxID=27687 RepID=A0A8C4S5S9_ERPCA
MKWSLPGWKIEQKYSNKVLIGNWEEERKQVLLDRYIYSNFICPQGELWVFTEGLPKEVLFGHHMTPASWYLVSTYDEFFNRRGNPLLPARRYWDGNRLAWLPERSDHPIPTPPTNFGLLQSKVSRWRNDVAPAELRSMYKSAFQQFPSSALYFPRYVRAPRWLCSKMHKPNSLNKDLHFRDKPILQVPEQKNPYAASPPFWTGAKPDRIWRGTVSF